MINNPITLFQAIKSKVEKSLKAAVFGCFDGLSAALGVTIPAAFLTKGIAFKEALGVALAEFVGMGLGEWLSESNNGFGTSAIIGIASAIGVISPALPFLFLTGLSALLVSASVLSILGIIISLMRASARGVKRSFLETFGILGFTYVVVWASSKF